MSTKKMQIIGLKGKSAYQYAQDGGYTGTEAEFKDKMAKELEVVYDYEDLNEAILATVIKPEVRGEFIHLTDSAELPILDFGMEGKTEQFTTSGKNLWSLGDIEVYQHSAFKLPLPAGTYTFSAIISSTDTDSEGCLANPFGYIKKGTSRTSVTKTFTSDITELIIYASDSDAHDDGDTATFKDIQIEPGSTATTYEPYTGAQPSPNPNYPQEIINAGTYNETTGRYEIGCKFVNKNIWDAEYASDVSNWFTISSTTGVIFLKIPVVKGQTYSIGELPSTSKFIRLTKYTDLSSAYYGWVSNPNIPTTSILKKFTTEEDFVYLGIASDDESFAIFQEQYSNYLQIELGSTKTDYVVGQSQPFTLTSPVPLTKWDKLVKRDGVYGWRVPSRYKKFLLDNWKIANRDSNIGKVFFVYKNFVDDHINTSDEIQLCTHFIPKNPYSHIGDNFWLNNSELRVGLSDETITTVEAFVEKLESLGEIGLWYESTTEEFHPLPDNEQALLKSLETYYQVTNIYNDQNCPMSIQYIADTQTYVDNLAASLTNAVVSLGGEV